MYASKEKKRPLIASLPVTAERGVQSSAVFLVSKGKQGPSNCMPHMQLAKVSSSSRMCTGCLGGFTGWSLSKLSFWKSRNTSSEKQQPAPNSPLSPEKTECYTKETKGELSGPHLAVPVSCITSAIGVSALWHPKSRLLQTWYKGRFIERGNAFY